MLHSKDNTLKLFGLEIHDSIFQIITINEFCGFSKIMHVKLTNSERT